MLDINAHVNLLVDRIGDLGTGTSRVLVAISGAPGSGKSTLAAELARRLRLLKCATEVLAMDGFHLDNAVLDARGLRPRKGAPETFDADGFVHLVKRLRAGAEVIAPTFDRQRDMAIAGAVVIPAACNVVVVEGNYLLLNQDPWRQLAPLWDLTVGLDVPMPELRARLIQRWLSANLSRAAATRRAESNDIPNAQRVIDNALPAEIVLDGQPRR